MQISPPILHLVRRALPAVGAALAATVSSCAQLEQNDRVELALPQADEGPWVGDNGRVVGFSGSYSFRDTDSDESERFSARATVEEFVADNHALGAYALGQFSNVDSDPDGREQLWFGFHYHYHLHLTERTSLFAGPTAGLSFLDDENSSGRAFTYGLSGGLRHWMTERAAFTVEPTYLRAQFDEDAGGDSDEFLVLWGFAFSL